MRSGWKLPVRTRQEGPLDALLTVFGGGAEGFAAVEPSLRCDCGYEVVGSDEESLVAEIRRHAWEAHGVAFTDEEALAVILRHELTVEREV